MTQARYQRVASASALGHGDIVGVEVDGVSMILFRIHDRFYATQRRCPHQGFDLVDGLIVERGLLCGVHGWRFDADTGAHDSSPVCLVRYPVRLVGDDVEVAAAPIRQPDAPWPPTTENP